MNGGTASFVGNSTFGPSLPASHVSRARKGSGSGSSPPEQFHGSVSRNPVLPRWAVRAGRRTATPTCAPLRSESLRTRKPGSAGSRPSSPRPPEDIRFSSRILFLGSTCRARATLPGAAGPQAVSRRPGSPREARSEGPKVLIPTQAAPPSRSGVPTPCLGGCIWRRAHYNPWGLL